MYLIPKQLVTERNLKVSQLISVDQLAEAIAERIGQSIPLSIALWDATTIAAYLKVSTRHVSERIVFIPDFPKGIRLPSEKGQSHRRWKAVEVIQWVDKYQE